VTTFSKPLVKATSATRTQNHQAEMVPEREARRELRDYPSKDRTSV